MDDRELLKYAAKSAGIELWEEDVFITGLTRKVSPNGILRWNPLTDDGDALRLAVKLGLAVSIEYQLERTAVLWGPPMGNLSVHHDSDPCSATRRAIVRAAAEIGKAMP